MSKVETVVVIGAGYGHIAAIERVIQNAEVIVVDSTIDSMKLEKSIYLSPKALLPIIPCPRIEQSEIELRLNPPKNYLNGRKLPKKRKH